MLGCCENRPRIFSLAGPAAEHVIRRQDHSPPKMGSIFGRLRSGDLPDDLVYLTLDIPAEGGARRSRERNWGVSSARGRRSPCRNEMRKAARRGGLESREPHIDLFCHFGKLFRQ